MGRFQFAAWIWLGIVLAGCSNATPTTQVRPAEVEKGVAKVRQVEVLVLSGESPEVRLAAEVELPDACTAIDQVNAERVGPAFRVTITTARSGDADCPGLPLVVDRLIPLDVAGLTAGTYRVAVNEATTSFQLGEQGADQAPPTSLPTGAPPSETAPAVTETPEAAGQGEPAGEEGEEGAAAESPAPPEPAAKDCDEKVGFFGDVTVPDGTFFRQEERFTKTWKLRNEGTCKWGEGYTLVFSGGELLNAPLSIPLAADSADAKSVIAPGEILTVSVDMAAPAQGGTYISRWLIQDPQGVRFGMGSSRQDVIYAKIVVGWVDPFESPDSGGSGGSTGGASCGETRDPSFDSQILSLLNAIRIQSGLRQLVSNPQLAAAAAGHSADMACNNFTGHTGSDGSTFRDRVEAQGYDLSYASENIYFGFGEGFGDPQTAVDWWMNSQEHRDNILNPNVTEIGIGYVYYANSLYGGYYTTNFARP
jgi:uncharacterized protein YkwD